ncbi:Retron-type RNA-directed DNA polymerase (EC 2.7.7.49) [Methylomonas albis]|uniref:RNA-directed DNA polymerase n=1 Tax=Methylomonas albis TaxID=1854563 RepID=A0ABR9D2W1_9GAMM|nr:retron St85 family RNA-directed DNA polymerase [Methylomonas albis]MBD9357448.1 RNA-directed DNA polymerase [Methylomonas albis]CAD6880714.1 Retron-type RNA-directed DNA polymerase (EC 2.7.7.49) [Methylomonas albis]
MILQFLSNLLNLEKREIIKFIASSPYRYKVYSIPKRKKGEFRLISQPSSQLKFIQKATLDHFFSDLPVHSSAMAYIKGKGIKDNALMHAGNAFMLKMDFQDYFPSIKPEDFVNHIKSSSQLRFSEEDEFVVCRLFFWSPVRGKPLVMSIGAPSSPFISNTVMYPFDEKVDSYCKNNGVIYSRYADDLVFSTCSPQILSLVPKFIEETIRLLSYPKLKINREKTVFSSKKHNRHITGLTITNESTVSIGRARKRYVSSLVHRYTLSQLDNAQIVYLKGYLAFCSDVEITFVKRLEKKYGESVISELLKNTGG